jgi:hypothetical protein
MGVVTQIHCLKTSKHAGRFRATIEPGGALARKAKVSSHGELVKGQ